MSAATRDHLPMDITFSCLHDALRAAGLSVGVELDGQAHRIVITDPDAPRWIHFPVDGDFDRTANVLVLSAGLRERLTPQIERLSEFAHGRTVVTGCWPELEALALSATSLAEAG